MSRMLMLVLTLLCSTAWLAAQQDQYPQNPQNPPSASSQTGPSSGQNSVEGCLQGSNGNFTLTDNSGTIYQLQGDTSKLSKHVGHQVRITGSTSGAGSASSSASASQGGSQQQTLTVEKMKHISENCKTMSK